MLEQIRRSTKSGWTYLLVGLLIVIFAVFFGVPGDACGSGTRRALVAQVGSSDVYTDDVGIIFNRSFGNQRRLDDSQLRQQRAQSLRAMLLIHLLADKARAHGLRVADQELIEYLQDPLQNIDMRIYGNDGFDGGTYKAYIQNQLRVSIPRYEDFKRDELLARKYLNMLEMQFRATGWELEELHSLRNTQVDLEFVKFDPTALSEFVPVTDEDVAAYVASNAADIKKFYEDNKADYEDPAQVLIRRIFIEKPEESDGEDKVKAAIEKWDKAKAAVSANPDSFPDVAGELSDSEKETQGLMEWTTLENLDQNIAEKVKDVEKGKTAEVETGYAFMLVRVEDRKEASKTPLEDVQTDIARNLLQEQKSEELVKSMIAELKTAMEGKDTLQAALDSLKPAANEADEDASEDETEGEDDSATKSRWDAVMVDTTGPFSLEGQDMSAMFGGQMPGMTSRTPWDRVPKIGKNPDLARDAFQKLTKEKPFATEPYKTNNSYFFVRLADRIEPSAEQLTEGKATMLTELRAEKVQQVLGPYAAVLTFPLDDYGPFLETMLSEAIDSGEVKLYERNYDAIPLITGGDDEKEAEAGENKKIDLSKPPGEGS